VKLCRRVMLAATPLRPLMRPETTRVKADKMALVVVTIAQRRTTTATVARCPDVVIWSRTRAAIRFLEVA